MRVFWTRQNEAAWTYAKEVGYLEGNSKYAPLTHIEAYEWMMAQMKLRLPKYKGEYPIWLSPEQPVSENGYVLLEIELEDSDVLLSDRDKFQAVHQNFSLLEETDEDYEAFFYAECEEQKQVIKRRSWKKVFDNIETFQGTTGRIELSKIKEFK